MHELSLAEGVLSIIQQQHRNAPFGHVKRLQLEIGQLAGVEIHSLLFSLEAVFRDTLADGAKVEVMEVEGKAFCFDCNKEVLLPRRGFACPTCCGYQMRVCSGDNMRVIALEVE
ncbi:hydrogenase maturation nickel metallochaperone HypA [Ferrimonas balearica]|uniref:hydrogenase maturation nickel metallochaperone HypA/HybF n=1 Tax=Ferrimonas balearica TaxID=44012 RepID=UPI001C958252|nr:hydrogenase maturation nickel metallochaperone HypA [Ferrimonas balearica]MBY5979445.1 hydrogenase maturation nickel metallochaperone HypA [Ferrimonas balearica]